MFTRSARIYDAVYSSIRDYPREAAELDRLIQERRPGARTLLDVACGTGAHLEHLAGSHECRPARRQRLDVRLRVPENDCDTLSGIGCTAPPHKARFYPFWSIGRQGSSLGTATAKACLWNFGDRTPGITSEDFNGDAQYGVPDVVRYGGTLTSTVMPNPQLTSKCRA